jgi:DICT domain-containing protein
MKNSEELREEARRLRRVAEQSKYPDMEEKLREIARKYDRIADRAEEHEILS